MDYLHLIYILNFPTNNTKKHFHMKEKYQQYIKILILLLLLLLFVVAKSDTFILAAYKS